MDVTLDPEPAASPPSNPARFHPIGGAGLVETILEGANETVGVPRDTPCANGEPCGP